MEITIGHIKEEKLIMLIVHRLSDHRWSVIYVKTLDQITDFINLIKDSQRISLVFDRTVTIDFREVIITRIREKVSI